MSKHALVATLLAALAVGWLIGSMTAQAGSGDGISDEVASLREENARLRLTLGERTPELHGANGGEAPSMGSKGDEEVLPPPPTNFVDTDSFDIRTFEDPDKAFQALLSYAATMLDKGEAGHFELLETLSTTFFDKPGEKLTEELAGGDDQMMRFLYPVIRFAMNRQDQVADLAETVFKTMAENPKRFESLDDDTLELFTEPIAPMLPGIVGPKRLDRFRAYAKQILATDVKEQPNGVQRQRRNVQKALESWAPRMTPAEAFARLQRGDVSPEEAGALIRRLEPADLARLDVDTLLGPLMEKDPWQVIPILARAQLSEGTIGQLDGRIIQGVVGGTIRQAVVGYWLRYTKRASFAKARDFIELGLQRADKATAGTFLLTALAATPGPDEDWIAWAEGRYEFSDQVRAALLRMREKK